MNEKSLNKTDMFHRTPTTTHAGTSVIRRPNVLPINDVKGDQNSIFPFMVVYIILFSDVCINTNSRRVFIKMALKDIQNLGNYCNRLFPRYFSL